jgi:hypothetical protein
MSADVYEPPETTVGEEDCPEDEEGVWVGCCKPLPELLELELLEVALAELEADADWLVELLLCP